MIISKNEFMINLRKNRFLMTNHCNAKQFLLIYHLFFKKCKYIIQRQYHIISTAKAIIIQGKKEEHKRKYDLVVILLFEDIKDNRKKIIFKEDFNLEISIKNNNLRN